MYTKNHWRSTLLRRRRRLQASVRSAYSAAIVRRLRELPQFQQCGELVSYRAMGAEVDLAALTEAAQGSEKRVCIVPSTGERNGREGGLCVDPGIFGEGDLGPRFVVVPGVGFDLAGVRLGRGGGYVDRLLAELRRDGSVFVVGAAFEVQVVPQLPCDPWDQSVDLIATESRLIVPRWADVECELPTTRKGDNR